MIYSSIVFKEFRWQASYPPESLFLLNGAVTGL